MIGSRTKDRTMQRHRANDLLQMPTLMPMPRTSHDLSVDQPDGSLAGAAIDTAIAALQSGQTHYVDVPGIPPLREKAAAWLQSMGLADYAPANVVITAGSQESRFLTLQMIGEALRSVGLPDVVHPGACQAAGVRSLIVHRLPCDEGAGYLPTLDGLRAALANGCRLLYLESPSRLTGVAYDGAAVAEIAALVQQHDAAVIWDQGLAPWVSGDYRSLGAEPGLAGRVAVMGELWPGVGLESLLIGYIGANAEWVASITSQKQIMSICTSTPSQYAALKSADVFADRHPARLAELQAARQRLPVAALSGAAVHLVAARLTQAQRAALHAAGFDVADGADFGAPGITRLAVTSDSALADALAGQ